MKRTYNTKEQFYYLVWFLCEKLVWLPMKIGNSAVDKLNKSYFNIKTNKITDKDI